MSIVDTTIAESKRDFKEAVDNLTKLLMLNTKFSVDKNGNIESTGDNLKLIVNLDSVFNNLLIESGYMEAIDVYLENEARIISELSK